MEMLKLCLVNPDSQWFLRRPHLHSNIGLMYLAGVAREAGVDVEIVDKNQCELGAADIPAADVYGLSGYHIHHSQVTALCRELKKLHPEALVVAGGPVALSIARKNDFDHVVVGHGEEALRQIFRGEAKRKWLKHVPVDVDSIPWPARDLWPGVLGEAGGFIGGEAYFDTPCTPFTTSRGCPHNCAFCANKSFTGSKVAFRSVGDVVAEMAYCVEELGIRNFYFTDENFNCNAQRVIDLCEAMTAHSSLGRSNVAWRCAVGARSTNHAEMTLAMYELMYTAGCREVGLGVESGDDHVLKACNKHARMESNILTLMAIKEAGIKTKVFMVAGLPGTTERTFFKDMEFLVTKKELIDTVGLSTFVPVPGSDAYENPKEYGLQMDKQPSGSFGLYNALGQINPHVYAVPVGVSYQRLQEWFRLYGKMLDFLGLTHGG